MRPAISLQQNVNGGAWATLQNTAATSWTAGGEVNGNYGYQVRACDASGCGPWSSTGTVNVVLPPGTSSLSVPSSSTTGAYTVSWTAASGATSYTLREQLNGGAWTTVANGAATSWGASGKTNGTYGYQVQPCNSGSCNAWSATASINVLLPPPSPASISVPSTSSGSIAISWSASATTTSYGLDQSFNSGAWAQVYSGSATNTSQTVSTSGNYSYRAYACNAAGCSSYAISSPVTVTIAVPLAFNGKSYQTGYLVPQGKQGYVKIGFDIAAGNTWEIFTVSPGTSLNHTVVASGAIPATAVTVQYAWVLVGPPAGDTNAGGSVSNPASSPVSVSGNPSTQYTTNSFPGSSSASNGNTYQLTVTFFNSAGANLSRSTCSLTAEVMGSN